MGVFSKASFPGESWESYVGGKVTKICLPEKEEVEVIALRAVLWACELLDNRTALTH